MKNLIKLKGFIEAQQTEEALELVNKLILAKAGSIKAGSLLSQIKKIKTITDKILKNKNLYSYRLWTVDDDSCIFISGFMLIKLPKKYAEYFDIQEDKENYLPHAKKYMGYDFQGDYVVELQKILEYKNAGKEEFNTPLGNFEVKYIEQVCRVFGNGFEMNVATWSNLSKTAIVKLAKCTRYDSDIEIYLTALKARG